MWYIYDKDSCNVISTSETEVPDVLCAYMGEDIDLNIYNVIVGNVQEMNGVKTVTFVTKKLKSNYELASKIKEFKEETNLLITSLEKDVLESELETDLRLSMLELGLI